MPSFKFITTLILQSRTNSQKKEELALRREYVRGKKVDAGDFCLCVYVSIPHFEIGLHERGRQS